MMVMVNGHGHGGSDGDGDGDGDGVGVGVGVYHQYISSLRIAKTLLACVWEGSVLATTSRTFLSESNSFGC